MALYGSMAVWQCGSMAVWHCMAVWQCGSMAVWHCMAPGGGYGESMNSYGTPACLRMALLTSNSRLASASELLSTSSTVLCSVS